MAAEFLDWLAIPPGRRWLDIGCGTGVLTQAILARFDPRSVVGVDPSDGFLELARSKVRDERATFLAGSADATGLDDGAADVAVAGLVLNFVPDVDAALAEARRVVRPGGVIAGYVWDYAKGMEMLRRFWDVAIVLDPAARALDEGPRGPITAEDGLARAFASAGLEEVHSRPIDIPTVFTDFDDLWTPFLGGTGPGPAYVVSLTESARDALREQLRASVTPEPNGSIRLMARAWAASGRRPA